MDRINLLVTLDSNYLLPLKVLLTSIFTNNPHTGFAIYMIHSDIPAEQTDKLAGWVEKHGSTLHPVRIGESVFSNAPVISHYTKAMYYRLLAFELLPDHLDRILYLDPDILVVNPLDGLYLMDLSGYLFAAAIHTALTPMAKHINRLRLNTYETEGYYNSGVLLMNLNLQRETMRSSDMFAYVEKNKSKLILPDQDILNGLYGDDILPLDDSLYNFDARKSRVYYMASGGTKDIDWVMNNTVILHFCGRQKPWKKGYTNRFGVLYKHYQKKTENPQVIKSAV